MKILGITGGIGSGKTSVTRFFSDLGATVIDADCIARQILEPGGKAVSAVVDAFGKDILGADGRIDRRRLAGIVFADAEKLALLNRLTHPRVFEEMKEQIKAAETELVCLDVPLLFSCDFPISCDQTLAVIAPKELRIARVMERDHMSREQVEQRMEKQLSDEVLCEMADLCIVNDKDTTVLEKRVEEIYRNMMGR